MFAFETNVKRSRRYCCFTRLADEGIAISEAEAADTNSLPGPMDEWINGWMDAAIVC